MSLDTIQKLLRKVSRIIVHLLFSVYLLVQVHVHDTSIQSRLPVVGHLVPIRAVVVQARRHRRNLGQKG